MVVELVRQETGRMGKDGLGRMETKVIMSCPSRDLFPLHNQDAAGKGPKVPFGRLFPLADKPKEIDTTWFRTFSDTVGCPEPWPRT